MSDQGQHTVTYTLDGKTFELRHTLLSDLRGNANWWIAHEFPERPPDKGVVWDWACDACVMHLTAAAIVSPDEPSLVDQEVVLTTVRDAYAQCMEWRAKRGLRIFPLPPPTVVG